MVSYVSVKSRYIDLPSSARNPFYIGAKSEHLATSAPGRSETGLVITQSLLYCGHDPLQN